MTVRTKCEEAPGWMGYAPRDALPLLSAVMAPPRWGAAALCVCDRESGR